MGSTSLGVFIWVGLHQFKVWAAWGLFGWVIFYFCPLLGWI